MPAAAKIMENALGKAKNSNPRRPNSKQMHSSIALHIMWSQAFQYAIGDMSNVYENDDKHSRLWTAPLHTFEARHYHIQYFKFSDCQSKWPQSQIEMLPHILIPKYPPNNK